MSWKTVARTKQQRSFFKAGSVGSKLPSAYIQDVISQSVHLCSTPPYTHSRFLHFAELSNKTSQKGESAFRCYTTLFAAASLAFNCFALLGKGQELSGRKRTSDQTWDACREDMVSIHKLMLLTSGHHFFCYGR